MGYFAAPWGNVQRAVIVPNHTRESNKLAEAGSENIRERLGIPTVIRQTVPGGLQANREQFEPFLEEGDIVGGFFGDGTLRDILLALGSTPFISLGSGNARDIGRATHRFRNASPSWLIRHSQLATGYALACTIQSPGRDIRQEHAISYIGTGETAWQSGYLASDAYRDAPKGIRDMHVLVSALTSRRWFDIVDPNGEEQRLSDLTFANGPRMAKLGRFPVRHWEQAFRVTPVDAGLRAKVIGGLGMLIGHAAGTTRDEPYAFSVLTDTLMHFDGDPPIDIPANSEVTVGLHDQTYNLLTTRASSL